MPPSHSATSRQPQLLALVRSAALIERIRQSFAGTAFRLCSSGLWPDVALRESVGQQIVFETGVWSPIESRRLLSALATETERSVFVFWREGSLALAELVAIARGGANVYPVYEHASRSAFDDACIDRRRTPSLLTNVRNRLLAQCRDDDFNQYLIAALSLAAEPATVGELAASVGIGETNLRVSCRRAGLPSPVNLLGWSRSLHVVRKLADLRSVDANEFGGTAKVGKKCSEFVRYHTGKGPHNWLENGGFDALLDAFLLGLPNRRAAVAR
jgi:hypothetical protein